MPHRGGRKAAAVALACLSLFLGVTNVYADCLDAAALYHGVDPSLVHAIASIESGFKPTALNLNRNGSEDIGLMQINSSWLPTLARYGISRASLFDACTNAYVGTWILAQNFARLGLTWNAVGAYNAMSANKRVQYARRVYAELFKVMPRATTTQPVSPAVVAPVPPSNTASGLSVAETE
ncbi:hypothetical protein A8H28_17000 (plasmid) [Burkholderia gladioli pv. gladioli]|nr:hypothetical protein A8H28_17000 [Burkholderia gladioli pv. gladioli]